MATNEKKIDVDEPIEESKPMRRSTAVWNATIDGKTKYPRQFRGQVERFWRDRYATFDTPMSNIENAQDGFVVGNNGVGRAEGFFDSQAKADTLSMADLDKAYRERKALMQENFDRSHGPDRVRLTLLGKAEDASFAAVHEKTRGTHTSDVQIEERRFDAQEAFAALMTYDRHHNHPLANPDRDFATQEMTPQERYNWLNRSDAGVPDRKAHPGSTYRQSEAQYFALEMEHVYKKDLPRPATTEPLSIRNALAQETQRREEDEKARAAARLEKEKQVVDEQRAAHGPVFQTEPDVVNTADERYYLGTLKEVGHKPYRGQKGSQGYAVIEDRDGTSHEVWGKNVPGALNQFQPGDTVELRKTSQQDVEVTDDQTGHRVSGIKNMWVAKAHDFEQHLAAQVQAFRSENPEVKMPASALSQDEAGTTYGLGAMRFKIPTLQGVVERDIVHARDMDAELVDTAAKSVKIEGVENGVAKYSLDFNGQKVEGQARWNAETGEIERNDALQTFAYGPGLDKAMSSHVVNFDDREYIADAFDGYIGAAAYEYVREQSIARRAALKAEVSERAPAVTAPPEVTAQAAHVEATPEAVPVAAAIPSLSSLREKLGASKGEPEGNIAPSVAQKPTVDQAQVPVEVAQPNVESVVGQEVQPGQVRPAQVPQSDVSKPLDVQLGMHIESVRGSEKQADQSAAKLGVQPSPHLAQQQKQEQTREKAPALSVEETQRFQQSLGFKSRGIEMRITR